MTNNEIILGGTMELLNNGLITENECIHTYERWQELGYQVQRGEKAIIKLQIWKPTKPKKNPDPEELPRTRMFLKVSAFFASHQVQPIEA